ncbi:MAG: hypothetical protein ACO3C8_04720 [Bacilli bacterium]
MKYKDFFVELTSLGQNFSAPQPDFDTYAAYNEDPHKKEKIEELVALLEKNVPTSPDKWAKAKAAARSKFKVYPSAYANLWAAKKYKSMGGGWKKGKK